MAPQSVLDSKSALTTKSMDVADLILALCDAGEWELALKLAREEDDKRHERP